jgi:AmmeMemoRadiSam system protein A
MREREQGEQDAEKRIILTLARDAIEARLIYGDGHEHEFDFSKKDMRQAAPQLLEPGASFVTITQKGKLRGCIGSLDSQQQPLFLNIIENAMRAAIADERFEPMIADDIAGTKIEVSIIKEARNEFKQIFYRDGSELLGKLVPGEDGVVVTWRNKSAVFLPDVWYQFKNPKDFMNALCEKAGISSTAWERPSLGVKVEVFHTDSFSE